jgi:hypothetical protein
MNSPSTLAASCAPDTCPREPVKPTIHLIRRDLCPPAMPPFDLRYQCTRQRVRKYVTFRFGEHIRA